MTTVTTPHKRVFILDDEVDRSEVEAFAAAADWPLIARFPHGIDENVELCWRITPETDLNYIESHSHGVRVLTVRGTDGDTVASAAAKLPEAIAVSTAEELLNRLCDEDCDAATLVWTWRAFGTTAGFSHPEDPMDSRLPAVVERCLKHPNRQVRLRTLMVCDDYGGRWPQLIDLVLARSGTETELDYVVDAFVQSQDSAAE